MHKICGKCLVGLRCEMNGVVIHWNGDTYHADLYKCPECGALVLDGFGQPSFDPDKEQYFRTPEKYRYPDIVQP